MSTYNIKITQASGTFSDVYRPETAAKYCYVSSDVAKNFGYSSETPVENLLSNNLPNNQYWWEKTTSTWTGVQGSSTNFEAYSGSSGSATISVSYSSSYSIDSATGKVSLGGTVSTVSLSYSDTTAMDNLKGKYFLFTNNGSHGNGAGTVFLYGNNSSMSRDYYGSSNRTYYIIFQSINPIISTNSSSTTILKTNSSSSYPIYSNSNGTIYRYLGQPSTAFKKTAKIIHGRWVGTGSRNAIITFEYWSLIVFIGNGYIPITTLYPQSTYYYQAVPNSSTALVYSNNTISFSESAPQMTIGLNTTGTIYYYTAIC